MELVLFFWPIRFTPRSQIGRFFLALNLALFLILNPFLVSLLSLFFIGIAIRLQRITAQELLKETRK